MGYSIMVTLCCDVCQTQADSSEWTLGEARRSGRDDHGWHFTRQRRDICPTCWAEGER